jgi:hypothetical protein
MNVKQLSPLLIVLWLAGCAATGQKGTPEEVAPSEAAGKQVATALADNRETPVTTDPTNTDATPHSKDMANMTATQQVEVLTLSQLLDRLDRVTTLDPGAKKQLINQMDAQFAELTPADRFEFALLLTKGSTSNRSLTRSVSILNGLEKDVKDRITLEILRLHRHYFALKKQYRSERSKTIELNKKIERLKGLEQDLDKSNTRIQESLYPLPDETKQP